MCAFDAIVESAVSLTSCVNRSAFDSIVVHPTSPRRLVFRNVFAVGFEHAAFMTTRDDDASTFDERSRGTRR